METPVEIDRLNVRRILPWVRMFRGFGIAIDSRKMVLATLAVLALGGGNWAFTYLPFAPQAAVDSRSYVWPWKWSLMYDSTSPIQQAAELLDQPTELLKLPFNWRVVIEPVRSVVDPAAALFSLSLRHDWWSADWWTRFAYSLTQLLWALVVWSVFGGAITRIAAVQFAVDERVGLRTALKFTGRRFLSYLTAPLLPLAGIGFFWLLCCLVGLVARIPFAEAVVGALWIVPLLFGFLMALMVIGVAAGWPLMLAGISAEGSDAFDGLNRTYSYVYERPWYYLWLLVLMMLYGSVAIFFVWLVAALVQYLAAWGVSAGLDAETATSLFGGRDAISSFTTLPGETEAAADSVLSSLVGGWANAMHTLVFAFVISYFWSATTMIYFLLRKSDDATDLDQVYIPEGGETDDLLPIVGDAGSAASQPEASAEAPSAKAPDESLPSTED